MASKGVLDRQRIADAIIASARIHAHQVGPKLAEVLGVVTPEELTAPDFTELQLQLAQYLEMRRDALVTADEAHLQELDDDQDPRLRRDRAAEVLYERVVAIREAVNAAFGSLRGPKLLGIEGSTSQDPLTLHRQAQRALERLERAPTELPPARIDGITLDLVALANQLQPDLDALGAALQQVGHERRETETTLGERIEAQVQLDRAVGAIGRILIGWDELAGFPHFAEKIRLSLPARRTRSPVPEPSPVPEDSPPSEELPEAEIPPGPPEDGGTV